tara:strand:- start:28 stop:291 length:264 start_codon:yes stop_codon:yes gene_type:complete
MDFHTVFKISRWRLMPLVLWGSLLITSAQNRLMGGGFLPLMLRLAVLPHLPMMLVALQRFGSGSLYLGYQSKHEMHGLTASWSSLRF